MVSTSNPHSTVNLEILFPSIMQQRALPNNKPNTIPKPIPTIYLMIIRSKRGLLPAPKVFKE